MIKPLILFYEFFSWSGLYSFTWCVCFDDAIKQKKRTHRHAPFGREMMRWQRPGEFGISKVHYTQAIQRHTHTINTHSLFDTFQFSSSNHQSHQDKDKRKPNSQRLRFSFFQSNIEKGVVATFPFSSTPSAIVEIIYTYIYVHTHLNSLASIFIHSFIHSFIHKTNTDTERRLLEQWLRGWPWIFRRMKRRRPLLQDYPGG